MIKSIKRNNRIIENRNNIWLPWQEPIKNHYDNLNNKVLVIIPTMGKDIKRLEKVIASIKVACNKLEPRIILINCPKEEIKIKDVEIYQLEGPFNYCKSVNYGLSLRKNEDSILFLNDDCYFLGINGLDLLWMALKEHQGACVGPWLNDKELNWNEEFRVKGVSYTKYPITGCCALWSYKWLEKIGMLDEEFGLGYGHDESDLCIKTLRKGGLLLLHNEVEVLHEAHSSFGKEKTNNNSQEYKLNLELWKRKYPNIHSWGVGPEWNLLPGIAVIMCGNNVEEYLNKSLTSLENVLKDTRWIGIYSDDNSLDDSFNKVAKYAEFSSADRFIIQKQHRKAKNAAEAKNKAIELYLPYKEQYPAVLFMDCDDEMLEDRLKLVYLARDNNHLICHGSYKVWNKNKLGIVKDDHNMIQRASADQQFYGCMSPCCTVIHSSLLHPKFWREDVDICEDALTFLELQKKGIKTYPYPELLVHHYIKRENSVMTSDIDNKKRKVYEAKRKELILNDIIY